MPQVSLSDLLLIELLFFLAGSIVVIGISRASFLHPHTHGLPRFFAFEAILGLVALNIPNWFDRPLSLQQLMSWTLLSISLILVIWAASYLRRFGKVDGTIQDGNRIAFEKTTRVVRSGPYRYIRHPMYASLIYFTIGVLLKHLDLLTILLSILASLALFQTARYEEQENLRNFGADYAGYMEQSKRFIPFVF